MRKQMQRGAVSAGEAAGAEPAALDDSWVWGVIFATAALTALALAALFAVSVG
jgi:hypothetical protein